MSKSREERWIEQKMRSGVSRETLLHTVGCFSNKKKERVMKEKNLTEKQYRERYDFLGKVYSILSDRPAPPQPKPSPKRENWIYAKPRRVDPPRKKDTFDYLEEEFERAGNHLKGIMRDPKGYLRDRTLPPDLTPAQKKRVEELMRPDPRPSPVYDYSKQFDFDKRGRIKGGYTPDGRFEPD